jgi:hypothetical protein
MKPAASGPAASLKVTIPLLAAVILLMLGNVLFPGVVLFSNDGPLGRIMSDSHHLPERFAGCWQDLNVIGLREGSAVPDISFALQWLLKPVLFSKFYAPITLLLLGLSAWCFFRQLGFAAAPANLAALAAVLNTSFFSAACWGAGPHVVTVAMTFLALAALADKSSPRRWLRVVLAGMAVGMAVSEGADIGALFSVLVAAFIFYQSFFAVSSQQSSRAAAATLPLASAGADARGEAPSTGGVPLWSRLGLAAVRLALVAACAAWLAADAISELVKNDIQGVSHSTTEDKTKHWNWATQWSLPKAETLSFIVPGLFGYRNDTPDGGEYWGSIGRDPRWDDYMKSGGQGEPPGFRRYTGGGVYAGVAVLLFAVWAGIQSFRKDRSVFAFTERRWIWFWIGTGVVCLLLAYGRFAPFYRWVYMLPYMSTIRNPAKFTHLVSFALIILFAYGVNGLWRTYVQTAPVRPSKPVNGAAAPDFFNKRWLLGCSLAFLFCALASLVYGINRPSLEAYLQTVQISDFAAQTISSFSVRQPWWFLLFFGSAALFTYFLLKGTFVGKRQVWAAVCLGAILLVDLGRANQPWIISWDYTEKYATNPVLDILRDKPYEHRVSLLPYNPANPHRTLRQVYTIEWSQHSFSYYNIQAGDVMLAPRLPADLSQFDRTFHPETRDSSAHLDTRLWALTNTRYLLGVADIDLSLNRAFDPVLQRFHPVERFDFVPRPGISRPKTAGDLTFIDDPNGPYCLFEFTGALPRAKLYSNWQISTNDSQTLQQLAAETFDPEQTVLVAPQAAGVTPPASAGSTNSTTPGSVNFVSYAPKHLVLHSQASTPSLLLLNDHYDPGWHVDVDGVAAALQRCNFVMRGVFLPAGEHKIEFKFQRPLRTLWVSLSAACVAVALSGVLIASYRLNRSNVAAPQPRPSTDTTKPKAKGPSTPSPAGKQPRKLPDQPAHK